MLAPKSNDFMTPGLIRNVHFCSMCIRLCFCYHLNRRIGQRGKEMAKRANLQRNGEWQSSSLSQAVRPLPGQASNTKIGTLNQLGGKDQNFGLCDSKTSNLEEQELKAIKVCVRRQLHGAQRHTLLPVTEDGVAVVSRRLGDGDRKEASWEQLKAFVT